MAFHHVLAFLSLWLGLTAAFQPSRIYRRTTTSEPLPPSQDPWYSAPEIDWEATEPGTVLRVRPAPGNLTQIVGNSSAAYNILYRTTDSQYKPAWAVTTLFIPKLGPNSTAALNFKQSALLSYQVPYDSADVDASPSYSAYAADGATGTEIFDAALSLGLFLNVPDYEGPLASFTAGVISGHATLDSIRAVLSLGLGLNTTDRRVALWGYSGGALASEWASELAVQYAPDLQETVVGAAIGGITPNISSVLESVSGRDSAGLGPSGILGLTSQYPAVQKYLVSQLKTDGPYNKTGFLAAENLTVAKAGVAYQGVDLFGFFKDGKGILRDPKILAIINRDGVMGYHGVPQWPIFAYQAVKDEISPIANTDKLIERYCSVGANILYQRNSVGSHAQEFVLSAVPAIQWLGTVLTGRYAQVYKTEGCTIQNVTRNNTAFPLRKRDAPMGVSHLWSTT
ncbi:lipase 4 [Fusarium heterosporum]|uniref:Lipase 4 n=1 Tax=Fusarium heterosporum TaxID=42747 RepID=A0A8H5T963_FUSHE|nr:lipase 4 [Fusarium heterosporum]